jgi:para-aminobenzoate synthetase component I
VNFNRQKSISRINNFASHGIPFLFIGDFEGENCVVEILENLGEEEIKFWVNGKSNYSSPMGKRAESPLLRVGLGGVQLNKSPISFQRYKIAFDYVQKNIFQGNSFLTNLTCETPIELNISLLEVFERSEAKYKIYVKDKFVCFSPEIFVQIDKEGKISSFPMKGTIDAALPDAEQTILNDKKEFYEHTTIVDLIRNDLSKVAKKVWVEKFRYIDRIQTNDKQEILQVSSQVSGLLPSDWQGNLGEILFEMLPAGSISGAPKEKTLEIIAGAEKLTYADRFEKSLHRRCFYTGICGVFDGETFDSGVMIRFIEKTENGLVFKSGGGITAKSIAEKEYKEMIQKIYVPIV